VEAKEGRVMGAALRIMWRRRHLHTLPATVVIALGTNIPVTTGELARALRITGRDRTLALGRQV
jgi:UDP-N-acetyl-D-mannosaminuronic acid transferase (WecB/TagA/CpsF family)